MKDVSSISTGSLTVGTDVGGQKVSRRREALSTESSKHNPSLSFKGNNDECEEADDEPNIEVQKRHSFFGWLVRERDDKCVDHEAFFA